MYTTLSDATDLSWRSQFPADWIKLRFLAVLLQTQEEAALADAGASAAIR